MKNTLLFTAFLFLSAIGIAQISFEKRIEFELKDNFINEEIFAFDKTGFLIRSRSTKDSLGKVEWKYDLYNTNLKFQESRSVLINSKLKADETYNTKSRTHTLFSDRKGSFVLLSVEASNLEITQIEGKLPPKAYIKEMAVVGDYAYFHSTIKRYPYLFSINWKTGKQNFIPVGLEKYNSKSLSIENFQIIEESNEVFLYVKAIAKKVSEMYVIQLNDKGEKKNVFNLSESIEQKIVSVSASRIGENRYIFTGTYSQKFSSLSEGLFFCEVANDRIKFIKFYNFLNLQNFLSYLPEKRQEKIEKKKAQKEAKGKELKINYYIATHDVILLKDGFLFLGEAYYPTYRTQTYTTYVNGKMVTTTYTVFDGYQYTHAVLAKFNNEGIIEWDQTFEMWPSYKPFYVKRFISVTEGTVNSIDMVFASRNRIVSKSFDFYGSILNERKSDEIETMLEGDKTKSSFSNIDYWYDNYFIAYGSQRIKNIENEDVKRKRSVFFISKIKY